MKWGSFFRWRTRPRASKEGLLSDSLTGASILQDLGLLGQIFAWKQRWTQDSTVDFPMESCGESCFHPVVGPKRLPLWLFQSTMVAFVMAPNPQLRECGSKWAAQVVVLLYWRSPLWTWNSVCEFFLPEKQLSKVLSIYRLHVFFSKAYAHKAKFDRWWGNWLRFFPRQGTCTKC